MPLDPPPGYGCAICGPYEYCPDDEMAHHWENYDGEDADEDVTEDEPPVCADADHAWRPAGNVHGDVECGRCGAQDSLFVAPAWADDRW